jgi:hypothetical protein
VWAKSLKTRLGIILGEPGNVSAFAHDLACVNVIGMRIFPVVSEDNARTIQPDLASHLHARFLIEPDVPIGQLEVVADCKTQLIRGRRRLTRSNLSRATRAHFAASHIKHSHSVAQRDKLRESASTPKLDIIGVRSYGQRIKTNFICHTSLPLREVKVASQVQSTASAIRPANT